MPRVPVIGLLLSALILLASCGPVRQPPAYEEMAPKMTWVAVDSAYQTPGRKMVYFDPTSIHREGDLVTLEILIDWNWMQGIRSPTRFYSTKNKKEFDCAGKRLRFLASINFYGHMGTERPRWAGIPPGSSLTNQTYWVPVESGSINHALWEVACGKS